MAYTKAEISVEHFKATDGLRYAEKGLYFDLLRYYIEEDRAIDRKWIQLHLGRGLGDDFRDMIGTLEEFELIKFTDEEMLVIYYGDKMLNKFDAEHFKAVEKGRSGGLKTQEKRRQSAKQD